MLGHLSMQEVLEIYLVRESTHQTLLSAFWDEQLESYLTLALGITEPAGNYSAHEHRLGPRILAMNRQQSIFELARSLYGCSSPRDIPGEIYSHRLSHLKISVGSEMAMMLRPTDFWVANVRTVWAHLLIKHGDNYDLANEELQLYRDRERSSEMDYRIWAEIYPQLEVSLVRLHDLGIEEAKKQGFEPGSLKFLWADAIATHLYHYRHR